MLPFVTQDSDTNQSVKQKMSIEGFFPIPIGFSQMDKALSKKILEFIKIKQLKFIKNSGVGGNSMSSEYDILDNDELSDIKKVLTDSVNEYFKEIIDSGEDTKLYITTSWINLNKNGESHHSHKHPNSIVSAILYIDTCEEDTVLFQNQNYNMFGNFRFSENVSSSWLACNWTVPVKTNTLMMFPSTLPHMVNTRPNNCTGTRISLSFNTWIRGKIGESTSDQLHF